MKDYENFVARMGSFDMDLTTPENNQDLLNDTIEQNGGGDFIRQNGSKAISKVVTEVDITSAQRQLKQYL